MSDKYAEGWHYINILDEFVKTGVLPDKNNLCHDDYLEVYLYEVMGDPFVAYSVLSDDIKARIFYDNMLAFIKQIIKREKFRNSCAQGQELGMKHAMLWSERKKRDGWSRLLSEISDELQEFGFDEGYYRDKFTDEGTLADEEVWKQMIEEWSKAFERRRKEQRQRDVEEIKERNSKILKQNIESIPKYLKEKEVEKEMFFQAWGMMGGQWNTLIFEQYLKVVKVQKSFPQLVYIANKMGRVADENSAERMSVSYGDKMSLEHATKSDILGVTLSHEIRSMLPLECVQCSDDVLYDLFLYKYATNCLQTFQHKSEMLKSSRSLVRRPARLKGPMVVCVDRSGSMNGHDVQVNSLMMRLLMLAEQQKRDLFLISFSVGAVPIDVKNNRTALLDFFRQRSVGDTSAVRMLEILFSLLEKGAYASADVLWCTDFLIPLCGEGQRRRIMEYRRQGTKFYGLKIGGTRDFGWAEFFDEIVGL